MTRIPAAPAEPSEIGELVAAALAGDHRAWAGLVTRYLPYVRAIARGYRLGDADIDAVGQTVCLRLVEHLGRIREPRALPAWIGATARNESLRLASSRTDPVDPLDHSTFDGRADDGRVDDGVDADLLRAAQAKAVRDGLAPLPPPPPTRRNRAGRTGAPRYPSDPPRSSRSRGCR